MKFKKLILMLGLVSMIVMLSACGNSNKSSQEQGSTPAPGTANTSGSAVSVNVQASDFKWDLDKTSFNKGDSITFNVNGKEGMHGFSIEGTDINVPIPTGQTKQVTWTPTKAGEYTIRCSVFCGAGHADMAQKITVQ